MVSADAPLSDGEVRRRRNRGRWTLILIALLFFAPIWLAMYLVQHWRPEGTVNNGVLVDPLQPVVGLEARALDGSQLPSGFFEGQWTLVYSLDSACDEPCELAIYHMRQVRLALGKDMDRVQRLLLLRAVPSPSLLRNLEDNYAGMDLVVADSNGPFDIPEAIHVVDPVGNLMMYYPQNTLPKGMIKDLKRLLKLSKLG